MNEEQLRAQLAAVYASTSWKLTAPLRLVSALLRRCLGYVRRPRSLAGDLVRLAARQPVIRRVGGAVLRRYPRLRRRVVEVRAAQLPDVVLTGHDAGKAALPDYRPGMRQADSAAGGMSQDAQRVLLDLRAAYRPPR